MAILLLSISLNAQSFRYYKFTSTGDALCAINELEYMVGTTSYPTPKLVWGSGLVTSSTAIAYQAFDGAYQYGPQMGASGNWMVVDMGANITITTVKVTLVGGTLNGFTVYGSSSADPNGTWTQLMAESNLIQTSTSGTVVYTVPVFGATYTLNVTNVNGTVTKTPDLTTYPSGTSVTLKALANPGYVFSGWSGDGAGVNNPLIVKMMSNKNITATFAAQGTAATYFTDNFDSPTIGTGWIGGNQYILNQSDGKLNVQIKKSGFWSSFTYDYGTTIKMATAPYVNLKVKTASDLILSIYLVTSTGKNILLSKRINKTDDFVNVSYDFTNLTLPSGFPSLDYVQKLYFAVNGSGNGFNSSMQFDEIKVGTSAQNYSYFPGIVSQNAYKNSTQNSFLISDIDKASAISIVGTPTLIQNINISPVDALGYARVTYDAVPGAVGNENLTLQSTPIAGYLPNTYTFKMTVADNFAPSFTIPTTYNCKVGDNEIDIKDIFCGDATVSQHLTFNATSSNESIIKNVQVVYNQNETVGKLKFNASSAGMADITVNCNDRETTNNVTSKPISVKTFNTVPDFDNIKSVGVVNNLGEQTINITGITDGGNNSKALAFNVSSSNTNLITTPTIEYASGSTASLKFTPIAGAVGRDTITVTLYVNDGSDPNNNMPVTKTFEVDVQRPQLTGIRIPLLDYAGDRAKNLWSIDGESTGMQTLSYEKDGADDVLKLNLSSKTDWHGLWYNFNDQKLDMQYNPYITMWVKSSVAIYFHLYFWDADVSLGTDRRNNMNPTEERQIPANTWTKVTYNFFGKMKTKDSDPLDASKIVSVLFNYHNVMFNYPFTAWTGTVWMKDIRIGDQADDTFVNSLTCTMDSVPNVSTYSDAVSGSLELSNVTNGNGVTANVNVTAISNNTSVVENPTIRISNGKTSLLYNLTGASGTATISVNVASVGSTTLTKTFDINIINKDTVTASIINIDLNTKYQTIKGIGTFLNAEQRNYIDQYINDFGGTAVRLGVIGNQLEKINDNSDPNVLNRSVLNYNAFDWNFINDLKTRGVETFLLTIWSPPAWMKKNASEDYGIASSPSWEATDNKVDTIMYDEYAEYIYALCSVFKEKTGLDIYVGLQNEPGFTEPYPSAILDPVRFTQLIKVVGRKLLREGIQPKIYMAEQVNGLDWSAYLTALRADKEASSYCGINAIHLYDVDGITDNTINCSTWTAYKNKVQEASDPKEFWMTERTPIVKTWDKILTLSTEISTAFTCADISLWTQWDFLGSFLTKGKSNQLAYAQSQYTKFVKPGAVRVSATNSNSNLFISSFVNSTNHGNKLATVIVNNGTSPVSIDFDGTGIPTTYDVQQTYNMSFAKVTANGMTKGTPYLLPAKSITTFTAQVENAAPTIDAIPVQRIDQNQTQQSVSLTGITDGGEGNQTISIDATVTTGSSLITNVYIDYSSPNNTALLHYTPVADKTGNAIIKVTVSDNGNVNNKTIVNCNVAINALTDVSELNKETFKVYPNPAKDVINVQLPDNTYKLARIYNIMGQLVMEHKIESNLQQININGFRSGMYYLLISGEKEMMKTQFIVK